LAMGSAKGMGPSGKLKQERKRKIQKKRPRGGERMGIRVRGFKKKDSEKDWGGKGGHGREQKRKGPPI